MVGLVGSATAQEGEYRAVDNPFQDDFEYRINTDLRPMVEVDGVRWTRFAIRTKAGQEIAADKNIPITVELEFVSSNQERSSRIQGEDRSTASSASRSPRQPTASRSRSKNSSCPGTSSMVLAGSISSSR